MSYIPLLSTRYYSPNLFIISKLNPKWIWQSRYYKIEMCETKSIYKIYNTKKSLSNINVNGYLLQFKSFFKKKNRTVIKMYFDNTLFCWYIKKKPFHCYFIIKNENKNIIFTSKINHNTIVISDNDNNNLLTFYKNEMKSNQIKSYINPRIISWLSKDIIIICHFIFNVIIIFFVPYFFD